MSTITITVAQIELLGRRCADRSCPFPAAENPEGECRYHHLVRVEPRFFESCCCSFALLAQAIYGWPQQEPDDARVRDRNRLRKLNAYLQLGAA
jgi:hypothetical protein